MANRYRIYLTTGQGGICFPVNPEEINIEYPEQNERYNVLALGEIVQLREPGLARISWTDGLLPGSPAGSWVQDREKLQPPQYYIQFLDQCRRERLVCTLAIDRYLEDGAPYQGPYGAEGGAGETRQVVVEEFQVKERGGETGDFYYDLTLTEYRKYSPGGVTLLLDGEGAAAAVAEPRREVPGGQLVVGMRVTVNGPFYYTSYGEEPHGNGNGRTAVVGRLITTDPGRPYPILLKTESGGLLGWCRAEAVTTQ